MPLGRQVGRDRMVSFVIRKEQKEQIVTLSRLWDVPQSWVVRHLLDKVLPPVIANPINPFSNRDDNAAD